ncbi:MAG: LuxR C-terminal-related transcriptional regulator [Pseudomonadota bacterium]
MTADNVENRITDHDQIVDQVYEIALNPETLEQFVDQWVDAGREAGLFSASDGDAGDLCHRLKLHLERAERFLQINDHDPQKLDDILSCYPNYAAFILVPDPSRGVVIEQDNAGATRGFGTFRGASLDQTSLPEADQTALTSAAKDLLARPGDAELTVTAEGLTDQHLSLFRLRRVAVAGGPDQVLVVSNRLYWRDAVNQFLQVSFGLTDAEQAITRSLAEGREIGAVAAQRGTSLATVRSQIKKILQKMKLRSQVDLVRFALAIVSMQDPTADGVASSGSVPVALNETALEREFTKPFRMVILPDGRRLAYHDMGPPTGNPVLFTHMGSCMVRWSRQMLKLAYLNNLRVLCPIRAGYGESDPLPRGANVFKQTSDDAAFLMKSLGVTKVPVAVQGTDFPFAMALSRHYPALVSEVFAIGGKPCLPDGTQVEARGLWQRFFVAAAQHNPSLLTFASNAVMAMSRRVGNETMLKRLCRDSGADLACLNIPDIKEALVTNIAMMAHSSPNIGQAFAREHLAFQEDWSAEVEACRNVPIRVFIAREDPTIDISQVPRLQQAWPWMSFEIVEDAGLALMFQHHRHLIPLLGHAAMNVSQRAA